MRKLFHNKIFLIAAVAILILVAVFFIFRKTENNQIQPIDPEFAEYVSAVTSGLVSIETPVKVVLVNPFKGDSSQREEVIKNIFSFSPSIDGFAHWINDFTVEFVPSEHLKPGTLYEASFQLDKVANVPSKLSTLKFNFQTLTQDYTVSFEQLQTRNNDPGYYFLEGMVQTADVEDNQKLEKLLYITDAKGKNYNVKWQHSSRLQHYFVIDSIVRTNETGKIIIEENGDVIGVEKKNQTEIEIPALNEFKVMDIFQHNDSSQYFSIYFSDPVNSSQNLNGLITFDNINIKMSVHDNVVKVFPSQQLTNQSVVVKVSEVVENYNSKKLGQQFTKQFGISDIKPAVELLGNGVIIPKTDSIVLPFKAVNLKAVDVTITKIYSNNICQFLQSNRIADDYNLQSVARPILKQRINLQNSGISNLSIWHVYNIDLGKLIKPDMGAIYNVRISFKKAYSMYQCNETRDENVYEEPIVDEKFVLENQDNIPNDNRYYYGEDYDYDNYWENRNNPCHPAYYNNEERYKSRNVLASNFGIIGKLSNQNELKVIVTSLTSAQPESGVSVEAFDFQNQSLGTGSTNGDGFCTIKCAHKPFLIVAKKSNQFGYLALKDGQSLSLSMFDIKGQETQKGLKGFIYGERGVWRPGDSLYLSFILYDQEKQFPKGHPIIFEFSNPKGQLFKRQIKVQNVNGFYTYETATPENAPTGNWLLTVIAGGAKFTKTIKIETIKPNRLAINLNLGKDSILQGDLKGIISAKWLHGALASNLKANINMGLTKTSTTFSKYPDFTFDDMSVQFSAQEQVIFDGSLDAEGNANFNYKVDVEKSAPGMLKVGLVSKVFEEGGNFSIDYFTSKYSPFDSYVGLSLVQTYGAYGWLYTDTTQRIKVACVDYKGKPVAKQGIKYELIKLDWHWWWDSSEESMASYINSNQNTVQKSGYVSTSADGLASFSLRVDHDMRGSYYLRIINPEGHQAGKMIYFYSPWYHEYNDGGDHPEAASMLIVTSNKQKYEPGEKARISFPATTKTRALVSIESGSRIIDMFWSDANPVENRASVEFEVSEDMAPNAYVNIMLLQPYTNMANDMPLRMYGYAPIQVENPETHLLPVIKSPEKVGSEEKINITVSEKNGHEMTYTLALVDEGLLNITHFKAPDPWNTFYAREALGINTWDIYNYIFGGVSGKAERLFAIGGDIEALSDKGDKSRNRFTPVVKFIGPFELKKGGKNNHVIQLPKYSGAVRIMVVAGSEGSFGCAEKTTVVKNPLMLVATLPRVLGPGEEVDLPVTIFADNDIKQVNLEVKSNTLFSIVGDSKKTVQTGKNGSSDASFRLKVKNTIGSAKVTVLASSGSNKADYEIELNVRNANEKETRVQEQLIEPGKTWTKTPEWFGMGGTNKAFLEVSICPPIDLSKRLNYLIHYPYGCIEQTTSSAFPQLYLNDIMDFNDNEKSKIENNIKATIERLKLFQNSEGAFTYWPGDNYVNDWGNTYAGHFILEAEKKGFNLPKGMKESWIQYQKKQAKSWPYNDTYLSHYTQAYRLMTLALSGNAETGAMNRLKESTTIPVQARWMLAYAYFNAGQKEVASNLIQNTNFDLKYYRETGLTYGSDKRDLAMILPLLVGLKDYTRAYNIVEQIAKMLASDLWLSTQETAFALMGINNFLNYSGKYEDGISFSYSLNGKSQKVTTKSKIFRIEIAENNNSIKAENNGKTVLYTRLLTEGIPLAGDESEIASNLSLSIAYFDLKGRSVDIASIKQGTDFKAVVKITNPPSIFGSYENLALAQVFPSGWEIINTRLADMDNPSNGKPDYLDIRDDRVYTFFGLPVNTSKTFEVLLNASYAGKFYMPAVQCEAMYDNNIKARKKGLWVEVTH